MNDGMICPIWGTPAKLLHISPNGNRQVIDSPRAGGQFELAGTATEMIGRLSDKEKLLLSSWIVGQNRLGNTPPTINSGVLQRIQQMRRLTIRERRDRLVQYLERKIQRIGETVEIVSQGSGSAQPSVWELLAWTESAEEHEVWYLIDFCVEEGLVKKFGYNETEVALTPKGYAFLDQGNPDSFQAFIAMWFDKAMDETYENGFERAIRESGYKPLRIDRKEHINKIDDEIIAEIRRSRFIVADFTSDHKNPRGGVYFEAGFALGLKIPVIWTCREDMIEYVHFDTRQFNHIVWSDAEGLYTKLKNRIGAVIGDGPLRPEGDP